MSQPKIIGKRKRVKTYSFFSDGDLNPGGIVILDLVASKGFVGRVLNIYIDVQAVAGGTTGTQAFRLLYGITGWKNVITEVHSAYNNSLTIRGNAPVKGNIASTLASDLNVNRNNIADAHFTNENSLKLELNNNTDGVNRLRRIDIWYLEEEM
jgi:hypothetical protein